MTPLQRAIDTAIDDFLRGDPLDSEALLAHLKNQGLAIRKRGLRDVEDEVNEAVESALERVRVYCSAEVEDLILPSTRERVRGIPWASLEAGLETGWADS